MDPPKHHTNRVPTLFQRPSGVFNRPVGVSPAHSAHSVSPDPTAMSQDSPARIGSFATTFLGSSGTSVVTVPPAPPQQQSPLQLRCNSEMRSIWSPQQVSRVLQGLPLAHADSIAETELLSRGSCSKNEEEARVEELLDGPASLSADLAELAAPPAPHEMKESATEEEPHGLNSNPVTIDSFSGGGRTSFAQRSFFAEAAVEITSPTTAARPEKLRRGKGPLFASPNTPLSLQGAALRSMPLERSAAASGFHSAVALAVTKMHLPLSPTRGVPSTSVPAEPRTSTGASCQSTADTAHVKLPPQPRPPQHTHPPPRFCGSSCGWDAAATSTQSSRAAFGAKRLPPLATFKGVDPSVRTSIADISLHDPRQVGTAPQAPYRESSDSSASSPVALHADNESSRVMSPNVSNPRTGATNVGESSAVKSLPHASRFDSSGVFPSLALPSASVALLSSQEEVRPSPSSLHTPLTDRSSRRNTSSSSPRPSFITRANSTALSTSASPHYPISLTPLHPPTSTLAAQHFPAGATRALRSRQHGVRSPLEAIWLRSEGLLAPSESMLSAEGCNKVDSPILNAASPPPAVAARDAGALLGSSSQRQSQLNVHELSSSMLSHEISTVSSGGGVVPGNAMSSAGPQPAGERERRSMMQRIFREPKKGGQRVWVSIVAPDSRSSSVDASEKS
ncbi:hypothetical protein, unknown function [Leishmania infantum JPCM5]|uniref:Uncharacterized protein n=2 Tax=Leishmania infantum TaxID=5671 RepID=A4I6L0_LEIIN|nr:hypothetical protein, unknown function [Leishmania infantum JPCM5]CAC9517800.1 hypothetical_protein_-_conserved [Leishmania infantum]CAM70436.1 hypothetical protein, unknown function [Leishmania infantum JPCM5]SUZ44258.1 hypothetical_protein_-_conserved [Leishmania infantum]|eukprot:XP_001467379.1 hypothetical protein, unknown function [Leishmania infantum JPCM5]